MGKPHCVNRNDSRVYLESIPAEVKLLSKRRKIEKFYCLSSGERNGKSPNLFIVAQAAVDEGSKVETF